MIARQFLLAVLAASNAIATPILRRSFKYGSAPVRGVNIGGWLVLEPWITPSIFQQFPAGNVVDEWTLCQYAPNAESILQNHWSNWATLADFQNIAKNGFNLVRIPIGYWAFQKYEGDPFIQGAEDYLDQAIGWARQTGLQVWIDLHGAPRSQNAFDNSGQRLQTPGWGTGDSVSVTENIIGQIAAKYGASSYNDVVAGIELLNEPQTAEISGGQKTVEGYYQTGFNAVRGAGSAQVIIQDGFLNPSGWNGFLSGQGTSGAIVDHHEYQVFSNALVALTPEEHVTQVQASANGWATGQDKFVIVGEWTAAMTDCAPALNGYGIGARYDDTIPGSSYVGSCGTINFIDEWTDYNKTTTTNYIQAQISTFEKMTQGWIFWNFKTEASAEWDLFRLINAGVWPSNF